MKHKRLKPSIRLLAPAVAWLIMHLSLLPPAGKAKTPEYELTPERIQSLSPPFQQELAGLQYLLNPFQMKQFVEFESDSMRSSWLEEFWRARDPVPTTEKNEMRIEHRIRVRLARQFYASSKWPGWDKRGEVFIRYGLPDFRGKVWGEVTARKMRPPGEIWFYKRHNMLVSFENFGLKGEYIYSIDPLGAAEELSPDMIEFLLYESDQALSSAIPQHLLEPFDAPLMEGHIEVDRSPDLPEAIDNLMDPDTPGMTPKDVSFIFQKDKVRDVANNFEIVLDETPASYPFNFNIEPLPFYFDIDQFKAGDSINRVEVHIELPLVFEGEENKDRSFQAEAVVWNTRYEEINRRSSSLSFAFREGGAVPNLIPTQLVFTLEKGYYRMGISVKEEVTGKFSSFRTTLQTEDYEGILSISDMLFASKIAPAETVSPFTRGALAVIPHPIHAYRKGFAVPFYFEIYNLRLDDRGLSSYSVEYRIIPHSKNKEHFWDRYENTIPIISSRFTSSGYAKNESQHLSIRTENLWEGSFDLLVTVTDDNAQNTAFRRASFSILE